MTVTEKAYGKINLCLDVISRRSNGYHNVESIMHTVPLCDIVTLEKKDEISISSTSDKIPTDSKNLAFKAANAFFDKTGITGGVHIHIEKNIPIAAGMAGGSTDAAATLRGLNKLYGFPLTSLELEKLGSKLGADVPFCIRGGTEGVTGIGYDFLSVEPPMNFIYVIACGSEGVSTPEMYGEYDRRFNPPTSDLQAKDFVGKSKLLKDALSKKDQNLVLSHMFNCFEQIVEEKRPEIKVIKQIMAENGCIFSMMSGSGPSVFGIFNNIDNANKAIDAIAQREISAFVCYKNEFWSSKNQK